MAAIAMQAYVPPRSVGNPPPHPKSQPSSHSSPRADLPDDEPRLICPRSSIESAFDEWEGRNGAELIRNHDDEESGRVKSRFFGEWKRTDQAQSVSAPARELIRELLDIAGPEHHRYTADGRQCVAVIWAGQKHIAELLRLTVPGVRSRMRVAARAGLISRMKRPFGRSSLTVVELTLPAVAAAPIEEAPNTGQSDCSGSRRALKFQPSVRGSLNAQCVEVASHLSNAASNRSAETNQSHHHTDESAKGLSPSSGSKDTDTNATNEPTFDQKSKVRTALIQLGVSPKAAAKMQASTEHRTLVAIVTVVEILRRQRPTADFLKNPGARGAWIGSIVFRGKSFGAWIRNELEGNARAEAAIEVLDDAGMIDEEEYPD